MGREKNGRVEDTVDILQESPDAVLCNQVQSDGRFVEKNDGRIVKEVVT